MLSREAGNINFKVIGLTQLGIKFRGNSLEAYALPWQFRDSAVMIEGVKKCIKSVLGGHELVLINWLYLFLLTRNCFFVSFYLLNPQIGFNDTLNMRKLHYFVV